ncbi:hypothetical protein C1E24_10610 [Pseudoalteromonas phenolica]|uniref:Uncharacterized protein n=1 Tax=Pseudoalteromonas phenolica TaxID=161398 RepID=A0A5R9Q280_9GAMM|nr:hypothetical protein [Pseudoalteromonas sp.]TLX47271.1 hypothetical protein C1E24_10610 [Pseudoalteromonas phenolica]TMO53298.1 hypothetical protein CWC21_20290 [Pseudoalteromonas phenolica]
MPKPSSPIKASPLNLRRTRLKTGFLFVVIISGPYVKVGIKNNRAYETHKCAVILKNFQH